MVMNDPIANALSKILNAEKIGKKECTIKPVSKMMKRIFELMQDNQYLGEFKEITVANGNVIQLNLLGNINLCGAVKPRFPVNVSEFSKYEKRYLPAKDFGCLFVSTTQGLMTHIEAKKKNLGGRLIAFVY